MESSKEEFFEQRLWESNQDPKLLGELIRDYLNDFIEIKNDNKIN